MDRRTRTRSAVGLAVVVGVALGAGATLGASGARAADTLPAARNPATVTRYPSTAASTRYSGRGFDACTAPALATMNAWLASPYRAVGVYVGGVNRACAQPQLSAAWVRSVTALGWKLLPTYVGRQPPCADGSGARFSRTTSAARSQGRWAAGDAIAAVRRFGIAPGSPIYYDLENYDPRDSACRRAVLAFVSAYTARLHARGYLAAVYANLTSGARHLSQAYTSGSYARSDLIWVARWDASPTLTGLAGIHDRKWAVHQRAKQYRGDHTETWGGVPITIDSDNLDAAVATAGRAYRTWNGTTHLRTGPSTGATSAGRIAAGTPVTVLCQTRGRSHRGTVVWDKLSNGRYVGDWFVSTPSRRTYSAGIPRCSYPYQVTVTDALIRRKGPSGNASRVGTIPAGGLAWVTCQTRGTPVGGTRVWNRLVDNSYVSDRYVATAAGTGYTAPIPRCYQR